MSETAQADTRVRTAVEGHLGVIALDRPEAVNALTALMVDAISWQLDAWRKDERVRAVLFEGRGPRGFCSGGDVRAVRGLVLEGEGEQAQEFFAAEYAMNAAIAGYPKPVIALCEGVCMGGGIGIAGHADFRLASATARFAMPESGIGFFCDVGVNAILARAPLHRALLFEMTGLPIHAGDALALGLTDCIVLPERIGHVRNGLVAASEAGDVETALAALMSAESVNAGEAELCETADLLEEELTDNESAEEIIAAIAQAALAFPHVVRIAQTLASRCPTSLEAIVQSHRAARLIPDIDVILEQDLRLARLMSTRLDFAEGVRAVLIDKDGKPEWNPPSFAEVPRAEIAVAISRAVLPGTPSQPPLSTS